MVAAPAVVAVTAPHDLDLVDRHRHGDPQAFGEIYRRYGDMVYNLAWRLCGEREEASDLTQEIFLRVFRHLGKFRGRSSLKTWIYRVAVNHCRSRLSRRRGREVSLRGVMTDPGRSPESEAMAEETGRKVAEALRRLPRRYRVAVVLRDLQGLTYEEIATVMGVRLGTVRSRLARGREQLRRLLLENENW